jgi:hypothetical protein
LIGELSTIQAAVSQLRDWARWNANDLPKEEEYMKGLQVALEGCQTAIEVLAEEIKDLAAGHNCKRSCNLQSWIHGQSESSVERRHYENPPR